ncbi:P1 family peptidase [Albidovulum sediminicola]|uniref:P1 family peptidase n=1 Tax=Albidovulum sediminicola TaxID=2984331 RepID=A0ABT2Z4Q6_9RHOB|nr:P1 family peptidase [Defluviimonas sp. WL0075]MCV2866005.1 P1 family peptidase [Defluviimonas sp. WL0075]
MRPGPRNLITDVEGLLVGNAEDHRIRTGTTVLLGARPFTAAVHVMGGAPGTRETDLLAPDRLVQEVDALVLSGGSALGLDAGSGVADALRAAGRGFDVGGQKVPIVPGAILFDLLNGGDKDWRENPYRSLGARALEAAGHDFALGTAGAGTGATVKGLKGGLGSASVVMEDGMTVGALVAVNALGTVTMGAGPQFWAAPWEMGTEFGGLGPGPTPDPGQEPMPDKGPGAATTIAIVATDARLTQAEAQRLAVAAHDGMARAIVPSHTPFDGDLVFAAATGARPLSDPVVGPFRLGHAAAVCLARAIARAVYLAEPREGDILPAWRARFGTSPSGPGTRDPHP